MIKVITGNEAAAYGALLSRPAVVCAYPITPQSRVVELMAEFHSQGLLKGKYINVESEMDAIGYVIGASSGGVRVFTATGSQGLAWMHEGLHWAAGARLPIVLVNVNRPIAAPWNLTSDQSDSLSQRDTGWMQFYCENNQEVIDTVIQTYRVSESIGLPAMVCLDGVYLSYVAESTDIPDQAMVDRYLPPYEPDFPAGKVTGSRYKLWDKSAPEPDSYSMDEFFESRYVLHKLQSQCLDTVLRANEEYKELFGRAYSPVEEYKADDADVVVVCSGSAVGTCRHVINILREQGHKVGLVKLKMFRPFPKELVRKALAGRKKVAVIERDMIPGQGGVFCQEIKWALSAEQRAVPVYGFVSGLGGHDITAKLVEKAILFTLQEEPPEQDVIWLGLPEKKVNDEYDKRSIKIY
ncbi:transketolase C-terminal domain-containing protein [Chloroflexota bacterium]